MSRSVELFLWTSLQIASARYANAYGRLKFYFFRACVNLPGMPQASLLRVNHTRVIVSDMGLSDTHANGTSSDGQCETLLAHVTR